MGVVSAIPGQLEDWSGWAQGLNTTLNGMARAVNNAVIAFNQAPQSPSFTGPIPCVGDDLAAYAARNQVIDQWVGQVGQAFERWDHQRIPPQVYNANLERFQYDLVTVPESAITQMVGGDPVQQAREAANGTKLASEVLDAQQSGDTAQVQSLLAKLAGQGGAFSFAFFQQMGSDATIKALSAIEETRGSDQYAGLLKAFDSALGQATNNPDWDQALGSALLDPNTQAYKDLNDPAAIGDMQLDLLRYGVYSEPFLTQAADQFVMHNSVSVIAGDRDSVVYNALARNLDAAYDYLTGTLDNGYEDLPRVQYLLENGERTYDPNAIQALGRMIQDAGSSDTASLEQCRQLLQDIGSVDTAGVVPDAVRPNIEALVVRYIGDFANATPPPADFYKGGRFPWQERLFMIAELNQDGSIDQSRVKTLQLAAVGWLMHHPPAAGSGPAGSWFAQAGNLDGLTLLPGRKADWNAYDLEEAQGEFWKTAIEYATGFLPEWAHRLEDIPLTTLSTIGRSYLSGSAAGPQIADDELLQKGGAALLPTLMSVAAAHDPGILPPELRGLPLSDPRVVNYLSALAKAAGSTRNPQYPGLTPAEQNDADNWANAISRWNTVTGDYGQVPVEGIN